MKRPAELGLAPLVALDRRRAAPLHRQLYDGYRRAIVEGRVQPGQRLPSTRVLSDELGISRMPIVLAFEQLLAEGFIESRVGAGSFVSSSFAARPAATPPTGRGGKRRIPALASRPDEPWLAGSGAFRIAQPAVDAALATTWSRLVARRSRLQSVKQMMYGDAMGFQPLREVLADYLRTVRSVRCTAEQIMIVSGSQQALALTARTLLAPGDTAWIEEPGFHGARDALELAGAQLVGVPVDDDGLDVEAGIARAPHARLAYVTPSHQYPLGAIMSAPRRVQLLDWAHRTGAWLLEDDYDSEYRYDNAPIASLQGLDRDRRVIYAGTFSKVLFPALRVGYLVIPDDLVAQFRRVREALDNSPAPLAQIVLHDFIHDGHFARHLRRMRTRYAERRGILVTALEREGLHVSGDRAGMHVVVELPRDREVARRAAERGLWVVPLSSCYAGRPARSGLLLGYGSTPATTIAEAVRRLVALA
jgi:GntR family transcriptional regulator/MocR family aminotransferase